MSIFGPDFLEKLVPDFMNEHGFNASSFVSDGVCEAPRFSDELYAKARGFLYFKLNIWQRFRAGNPHPTSKEWAKIYEAIQQRMDRNDYATATIITYCYEYVVQTMYDEDPEAT